jgi:chemotaxis response regulator CheB
MIKAMVITPSAPLQDKAVAILNRMPNVEAVYGGGDIDRVQKNVLRSRPQVVLVEQPIRTKDLTELVNWIKASAPGTFVIMLEKPHTHSTSDADASIDAKLRRDDMEYGIETALSRYLAS